MAIEQSEEELERLGRTPQAPHTYEAVIQDCFALFEPVDLDPLQCLYKDSSDPRLLDFVLKTALEEFR